MISLYRSHCTVNFRVNVEGRMDVHLRWGLQFSWLRTRLTLAASELRFQCVDKCSVATKTGRDLMPDGIFGWATDSSFHRLPNSVGSISVARGPSRVPLRGGLPKRHR